MELILTPTVLEFDLLELHAWKNGDRAGVSDEYLSRLRRGSTGFGEFIVGRHYQRLGYEWIHHDFDIFGSNKEGKYKRADEILRCMLGEKTLAAARKLHKTLYPFREPGQFPIEAPDLLLFREQTNELRFAECKRQDTGDRLNNRQVLGFIAIQALLRCPVDLFVVRPCSTRPWPAPISFSMSTVSQRSEEFAGASLQSHGAMSTPATNS